MAETQVVSGRAEMLQQHRRRLADLTMTFSSPEAVDQLLEALEVAAIEPSTKDSSYSSFAPGGSSTLQQNMKVRLSRARFDDRRKLLESLDRLKRDVDRTGAFEGIDTYRQPEA